MKTYEDYVNFWIKDMLNYSKSKKINQKVLNVVKGMVSKPFFEELNKYLDESGDTSQYDLTNCPPNDKYKQDESDYKLIKVAWVNQYVNGGYTDDEFGGQIWIKINNEYYFTFHYVM